MARVGMHNWSFHAGTGVYRVDVDLAKNPSLLVIYEDGWQFIRIRAAHGAHALMVSAILLPIGLATLVIGAIRRREEKQAPRCGPIDLHSARPAARRPRPRGANQSLSMARNPNQS